MKVTTASMVKVTRKEEVMMMMLMTVVGIRMTVLTAGRHMPIIRTGAFLCLKNHIKPFCTNNTEPTMLLVLTDIRRAQI